MRILLINPIARRWALPNVFPTGLGYIDAVLRVNGHDVGVLDFNAYRWTDGECQANLSLQPTPDLVGLTGIVTQYAEVKKIAGWCRGRWPSVPIVCGGPLATSVPDLLLKKTEIDHCVLGEGEEVIFDLLDDLLDLDGNRPVLKYHSNTVLIKNLATIPWPSYDVFPTEIYLKNPVGPYNTAKWRDGQPEGEIPRTMNVIGSRGCPAHCVYCYHNYMGQGYRIRPVDDLVREMDYLNQEYGAEYIQLTDDAFASSKRKVMEFCEAVKGKPYAWSCAGRANVVDEEMVRTMAESGCVGLWYGLESGSPAMLRTMKKGITVDQYKEAIRLNRKYFEFEDYTFMTGMMGETPEDVRMTIDFCREMEITPSAVFLTQAYPGTELFEILIYTGKAYPYDLEWMEDYVLNFGEQGEKLTVNLTDYPDEEVLDWHRRIIEETGAWNKIKH